MLLSRALLLALPWTVLLAFAELNHSPPQNLHKAIRRNECVDNEPALEACDEQAAEPRVAITSWGKNFGPGNGGVQYTKVTVTISAARASITGTSTKVTVGNIATVTARPPTTPTGTCAPKYTGASTTIRGTGTLPKPTAFVKRSGRQLQVNRKPYRPVGPNVYWLGLDENPTVHYPSKGRIREAMAAAVAMGANTIRSHTLGVSVGHPLSLKPSLNTWNEKAWDTIDYSIYAAREYGLRLIIPLSDEYDWYHGGKYTFLRWLNISTSNFGNAFYTNKQAIAAFKAYIQRILLRVNKYTGVPYFMDPTIMAWETGNEWGAWMGGHGFPPLSFTNEIASFIKSIDKQHLVMDGSEGFYNYTTKEIAQGVKSPYVDIMSDHLYPLTLDLMLTEKNIANEYNKNFFIGEFDWTGLYGGDKLTTFIADIEATNYMGDMFWSYFGHDDQCCNYVKHNDGYSMYYPNGNPQSMWGNILRVVQHFHRITGRKVPSNLPAVACPQPVF